MVLAEYPVVRKEVCKHCGGEFRIRGTEPGSYYKYVGQCVKCKKWHYIMELEKINIRKGENEESK